MWKLVFILGCCLTENSVAHSPPHPLHKNQEAILHAPKTIASLQRGAKYFMHFCSGCHSLKLMRYDKMAEDLQIIDKKKPQWGQQQLKTNLILTGVSAHQPIESALTQQQALRWFGVIPPDLSLITRARSINWVYNYLLGFYEDNKRPFGVNNSLVNRTAMPDPLTMLRHQRLGYTQRASVFLSEVDPLAQVKADNRNTATWVLEEVATDLIHFLDYVGEPTRAIRRSCGKKVCIFLLIFVGLAYLLKKQIWHSVSPSSRSD
jgi:ubiquinol-cytochrome c reductase cytochrome c1 subunit